MVAPSLKLERLTERYVRGRNHQILRGTFPPFDRLLADLTERLAVLVRVNHRAPRLAMERILMVLRDVPESLAETMEEGLGELWRWSWHRVTNNWVQAVPMGYWIQRLRPLALRKRGYREQMEELELDTEIEIQRIVDGLASEEEAKEIVRQIEFPPPSASKVERILKATNADDGLSAMQRIKTVARRDLPQLRRAIVAAMSEPDGASAVESLSAALRPLVGGIRYKARRIARTEGARIAQAAQDEARKEVSDLLKGVEVFTMEDANVRDLHRERWQPAKMYLRIGVNGYRARDGEMLPQLPAGPNCRCSSRDVLEDDLLKDAPPVNYGPGFRTSQARFRKQQKALEKPSKPKAKLKAAPKKPAKPDLRSLPMKDLRQYAQQQGVKTTKMKAGRYVSKSRSELMTALGKPKRVAPVSRVAKAQKKTDELKKKLAQAKLKAKQAAAEFEKQQAQLAAIKKRAKAVVPRPKRSATEERLERAIGQSEVYYTKGVNPYGKDTKPGKKHLRALAQEMERAASKAGKWKEKVQIKSVELVDNWAVKSQRGTASGLHNPKTHKITVAAGDINGLRKLTIGKDQFVISKTGRDTIRHEYGHALHDTLFRDPEAHRQWRNLYEYRSKRGWANGVSEYAGVNERECFAECFNAWSHPDHGKPGATLPDDVVSYFTKWLQ